MKSIFEQAADALDNLEERLSKQQKEAEAYEDEFKKKNKLYKAFCRANSKNTATIGEAEDFAIHILSDVLAKKTVGKGDKEIEEVFDAFHNKLITGIKEYRERYSYLLAMSVVSQKHKKK